MDTAILDKVVAATRAIYLSCDRASLSKAVGDSASRFGFDHFHLVCHKADKRDAMLNATLTTIPQDYLDTYEKLDWFDSDFIMGRAFRTEGSFFWDGSTSRCDDVQKQSFIDYLNANKMGTGVMTTMGCRPGTASNFGLISNTSRRIEPEIADAATIVGTAAMAKAEMLGLCPEISIDEATGVRLLTDLQLDLLDWIADGKSNLDIGTIMGLSERTVRYHVSKILQKLGVATRMQAAAVGRSTIFDPDI